MVQPTPHGIYPNMTPQTHKFFIIEGILVSKVKIAWSWSFTIFWLHLWQVESHEMLFIWIILALGVILFIIKDDPNEQHFMWRCLSEMKSENSKGSRSGDFHFRNQNTLNDENFVCLRSHIWIYSMWCRLHHIYIYIYILLIHENYQREGGKLKKQEEEEYRCWYHMW